MAYWIPNETEGGTLLTNKEKELIRDLKRIATKWKKHGQRLWLYSASGTLTVMMRESETNPIPEFVYGSSNPDNAITNVDIPNDGGDW